LFKSGYFSHQDDLQVIRLVEMRKCFADFQIPCRWVPDMGWGNGFPLFNFYGVFTYYLGAVISFLTGYLVASKILFFLSLIAGSFGLYLLIKELWGRYAGLTSAVLYMIAPYKALDVYVRGALAESMALTIIPFVLYFAYKKNFKLFTIFLFIFLITHNIMTIVFLPVVVLWVIYLVFNDNLKSIKSFTIAIVIAFGLSAFFVLPAFLEKDLVQTESLTRFELDYRANFVSVKQLFLDRDWGYGTSIPGPEGGMNFSIGWPHWVLVFLSLLFIPFNKNKKNRLLAIFCLLLFVFSIFMTHNKSTFIWEMFPILTYFQFPWRFLSLSILTSSILGGFVVLSFKEKMQLYLATIIIFTTMVLNWSYFKPREVYNISEQQKITGEAWDLQKRGAILDYLPKTALEPREAAQKTPIVVSGKAEVKDFAIKSNSFSFKIKVSEESKIEVPIYYFPNWEVYVDGKLYPSNHDNPLGRISFDLKEGEYEVLGKFRNTLIRTFANITTLASLILGIIIWRKYKN
jgi:ABC-type multidrug transport system fused ATPase/permease subunit